MTHTYPPDPPAQRGCHVTEKEDAQHLTPSLQHCSLSTKTGPTVIWSLRGHGGEKFSLSFSFHLIHSDQSQLFLSLPSSHGFTSFWGGLKKRSKLLLSAFLTLFPSLAKRSLGKKKGGRMRSLDTCPEWNCKEKTSFAPQSIFLPTLFSSSFP